MRERRHQKTSRAYHRSQEKALLQDMLDDYYDPEIESDNVAGGDPGIAMLMAAAAEESEGGSVEVVTPTMVHGVSTMAMAMSGALEARPEAPAYPPLAGAPMPSAVGGLMRRIYGRVRAAISGGS